ncbi:MAG: hypothetical protein KJZ93_30175, partial [Caldilineaceae bacterium]|nr:hypothetical protein [Caldilineaceae bacterium]
GGAPPFYAFKETTPALRVVINLPLQSTITMLPPQSLPPGNKPSLAQRERQRVMDHRQRADNFGGVANAKGGARLDTRPGAPFFVR